MCSSQRSASLPNALSTEVAQSTSTVTPPPASSSAPREQVSFGKNLRIVSRNLRLENESWRYKIDVDYPQIEGSDDLMIRNFNQHLKDLVRQNYKWTLKPPTAKDLHFYSKWPGVYNSVDIEYDVTLATDDLLSIYLNAYHYGIGAAHSVHESFSVNYDFKTRSFFTLERSFKPHSRYLQFISRRCIEQLSKSNPIVAKDGFSEMLNPRQKNFESWNMTTKGLRINFDACKVASCAEGDLSVEIPFAELTPLLNDAGPLRSLSTRRAEHALGADSP
jgi:Deacetylase PdaC/Protein of unknown function (DUF3298)